MFSVYGGVFSSFNWSALLTEEYYGPFRSYDEAYKVWKAKAWQNVDNGQHRLEIIEGFSQFDRYPIVKRTFD